MTKKIIFFTLIISVNFLQGNSQAMPEKTESSQHIFGFVPIWFMISQQL